MRINRGSGRTGAWSNGWEPGWVPAWRNVACLGSGPKGPYYRRIPARRRGSNPSERTNCSRWRRRPMPAARRRLNRRRQRLADTILSFVTPGARLVSHHGPAAPPGAYSQTQLAPSSWPEMTSGHDAQRMFMAETTPWGPYCAAHRRQGRSGSGLWFPEKTQAQSKAIRCPA